MTQRDIMENYKGCTIQHGHYNDRIYIMKMPATQSPDLPYEFIEMAKKNSYSKIFAKLPKNMAEIFLKAKFSQEAKIPSFYNGKEDALFLTYYLTEERRNEQNIEEIEKNFTIALAKEVIKTVKLDKKFTLRKCNPSDAKEMAEIYKKVFPSYPFPIYDPKYLIKTMESYIDYFGVETDGKLIALSSAEMCSTSKSVEMTDFATLPEWLGNKLSQNLLQKMEVEMRNKNMIMAYTIARAMSPGMNITFRKAGYTFGGRLKNNTNISGQIESMNIWYKKL